LKLIVGVVTVGDEVVDEARVGALVGDCLDGSAPEAR